MWCFKTPYPDYGGETMKIMVELFGYGFDTLFRVYKKTRWHWDGCIGYDSGFGFYTDPYIYFRAWKFAFRFTVLIKAR
jgi:hypothetical protein